MLSDQYPPVIIQLTNSFVIGQRSMFINQCSMINILQSVVNSKCSFVSGQRSMLFCQWSAVSGLCLYVGGQRSVFIVYWPVVPKQWSAVSNDNNVSMVSNNFKTSLLALKQLVTVLYPLSAFCKIEFMGGSTKTSNEKDMEEKTKKS